jgi:type VI secretion system protein ImpL
MAQSHFSRLSHLFPWSFVVVLLLALIFAALGVVIYKRAMKREEEEPSVEKTHPSLERIQAFFARFGFSSNNPLNRSFLHALKIMRDFVGGTQFRYQLPWIVMLGASDAGKSSILRSLDLERPIGRPYFDEEGEDKPLCDWAFYEHGIVLEPDGKLVIDASQAISDESNWQLFLNLLSHHRPKRPADGVVLTIPASELIGQGALSHEDIMIRAEYLYHKLWQMQRVTGMRVPIYVVISKCDVVPGFESFCKSIPIRNKPDIFGWSNDKALDSTYVTEWVDEAFSSITESLYRAQQEIYAESKTTEGRDGVFLFPIAFNQLKQEIRTYIDHLFKPSSYHESFFLRGIYFVGDNQLEKVALKPSSFLDLSTSFSQREEEEKRNIYFINNLFEKKIFREIGLARPVSRVMLGNTTAIRIAKIAMAVLVITGTLGLLHANEKLQKAKINLTSVLSHIDVSLANIRGQKEGSDIERVYFDEQAKELLKRMTQISVSNLVSVFIPPSWFSDLDQKVRDVMVLAYDRVILLSMYKQLNYEAQKLVDLNRPIQVTEAPQNGITPLKTVEFFRLRKYLLNLQALDLTARKFNNLATTSNLKDVADIIEYLFKVKMPESFFENEYYYTYALRKSTVSKFSFDMYTSDATRKLVKLFDEFQSAAFDPNQIIPGLKPLVESLYDLSTQRRSTDDAAGALRNIYLSLQETISSIQNPGLAWLNANTFHPGPQYEYVMQLIVDSKAFFTGNIADELSTKINQSFLEFRKRLAEYSSSLIEGGRFFESNDGFAIAQASPGALSLEKDLNIFFEQPFMAPPPNKTIITVIPAGSVLLWDALRLQEAAHLVDLYNTFMNFNLLSMPNSLQPLLQRVARENFTKNLAALIADAEVFGSSVATGSAFSPEDALLSQVQNYRTAAPYLEQLLFALKNNNANTEFGALKSLLTSQAYAPLEKLDSILREEAPYAIKMNSFEWWNGQNMAALEAFGVSNLSELQNLLDLQRDRIHYLAREFAEPLVSFLDQINKEGMPGNIPLVAKWRGIINEFNGYERHAPGNGLAELEQFILKPLNEVTLATCFKYANSVNIFSGIQDFFVTTLVDIQEKLRKQCRALSNDVFVDNYTQLSQFFNEHLAGKFPFVKDSCLNSPDAAPEDIRTFFELLDAQCTQIKALLKQATHERDCGNQAIIFIEQMEQLRSFFGDYLAPDSTLSAPVFSFDVDFRVNRKAELHANEILEWEVITPNSTISTRSSSHKGIWKAGEPVTVLFQWAANSPLQPLVEECAPNFNVEGEDVTYTYGGTWALLRLLREHQILNDENPITLRFDIPLTNVISSRSNLCASAPQSATVFEHFGISSLGTAQPNKSKSPPPEVQCEPSTQLPYFPFRAPQLHSPRT